MRLAMSIDLDRCVGCQACVSACKEQWDSGPGAARDWVKTFESGSRGKDLALSFYPGLCMQCEDHPCTADCPTGATYVDPRTGVVMVDAQVCIGCGNCISSCPYGARHVDPVKKIVEKCNLCAPFVARGEEPACVRTCLAECRIFGDLDDAGSKVSSFIRERGAKPLVTAGVNVRPKTTYAGDAHRERVLAAGVVTTRSRSWLTRTWGVTRPAAQVAVPAIGLAFMGGGLLVNLRTRKERVQAEEAEIASVRTAAEATAEEAEAQRKLFRHRRGLRFLHWFNALSWALLVLSGTALMSAASFALFGEALPRRVTALLGGPRALIGVHVAWGLLWSALIVPLFLLFKHGPREVLEEVRFTKDDLRWLAVKPLALAGLWRKPLPPQDKYNAGQKLFAVHVLLATSAIIGSGLVMTFHLGSGAVVAAAIMVHGLAVGLTLLGVAVHFTMAALLADERPALESMITGRIDYQHAKHHSPKWVERLEAAPSHDAPAGSTGGYPPPGERQ